MDYWFTIEEWGADKRTGAIAHIRERLLVPGDILLGKNDRVWAWKVQVDLKVYGNGISTKQSGARVATGECPGSDDLNKVMQLTGTPKKHTTRNGRPQTILTRCKFELVVKGE